MKKSSALLLILWFLHSLVFAMQINFYPVLEYDLFARLKNFHNQSEVFWARLDSSSEYNVNVSQEITFGPYWKFIVTIRRILRENPEKIKSTIQKRILEMNSQRSDKINAIRFVETNLQGETKTVFDVTL